MPGPVAIVSQAGDGKCPIYKKRGDKLDLGNRSHQLWIKGRMGRTGRRAPLPAPNPRTQGGVNLVPLAMPARQPVPAAVTGA